MCMITLTKQLVPTCKIKYSCMLLFDHVIRNFDLLGNDKLDCRRTNNNLM